MEAQVHSQNNRVGSPDVLRSILVGTALLFLNLVFVVGPYIGVWGIIVGFFAAGGGILAGGLAMLVTTIVTLPLDIVLPLILTGHPFLIAATGLIMMAVGVILMILTYWLARATVQISARYVKWQMKVIRGE